VKRVALLLALPVVLAACSGGSTGGAVATVDGREISLADIEALAPTSGTVPKEQFVQNLTNTIVEQILVDRAEADYGVSFTDEEIDAEAADLESQVVEQTGTDWETFLESQGLTAEGIRHIAHQQLVARAVTEKLTADVSDEEVEAAYDEQRTGLTEACVSHILRETEDEALASKERVDAGEDFGTVATEESTDPSAATNAGDLGCSSLAQYDPAFAEGVMAATPGEPTDPVESSFGFHIILVASRETPTLDDSRETILATLGQTLLQDWLLAAVADADVSVDAEYGTWTTDPFPQITPAA